MQTPGFRTCHQALPAHFLANDGHLRSVTIDDLACSGFCRKIAIRRFGSNVTCAIANDPACCHRNMGRSADWCARKPMQYNSRTAKTGPGRDRRRLAVPSGLFLYTGFLQCYGSVRLGQRLWKLIFWFGPKLISSCFGRCVIACAAFGKDV